MTQAAQKLYRFEVDQSGRIEELNRPTVLAIANQEHNFSLLLKPKVKLGIWELFRRTGKPKRFGPRVFDAMIIFTITRAEFSVHELIIDLEYPGYEQTSVTVINEIFPDISIHYESIGKKSPAHYTAHGIYIGKGEATYTATTPEIATIIKNDLRTVTPLDKSQQIRSPRRSSTTKHKGKL